MCILSEFKSSHIYFGEKKEVDVKGNTNSLTTYKFRFSINLEIQRTLNVNTNLHTALFTDSTQEG